jgi:hypothetical protein
LKRKTAYSSATQALNMQITYLDRHQVQSSSTGVLTSFKFVPAGGQNYRYQYTYVTLPASRVGKPVTRYTGYTDGANRDLQYLSRQNVDAGGNCQFLNSFRLQRETRSTRSPLVRYRFQTIKAPCTGKCTSYYTGCNTAAGKKIQYLDRHFVNAPEGYGLTRFQFTSSGCTGGRYRYMYKACQFKTDG